MSVDEYNKLDKDTKELVRAHSTITIDKLFIPQNINKIRPINYFNHSCEPNIGFDSNDNYIAIKDISYGDEFLLDYSFLNTNPDYEMKCFCGSKNCRKVITGNEWKNKEFVNKFGKYFASTMKGLL
jgi:SET domain-containing protein